MTEVEWQGTSQQPALNNSNKARRNTYINHLQWLEQLTANLSNTKDDTLLCSVLWFQLKCILGAGSPIAAVKLLACLMVNWEKSDSQLAHTVADEIECL